MQEICAKPLNTATVDTCATLEKPEQEKPFFSQIRYLGAYLAPHKQVLIFSLFLSTISTVLGMVQPYFAKILIDRVFLGNQPQFLFSILAALIALLIISFGIRVGNGYIYTRYSAKILFLMREDLFDHLQKISLTFFSKKKLGDIYSRIASDMADIQALVTDIFPRYVFDFLTCLISGVILFSLNWKMALMSLVFLPFAVIIVQKLKPRLFSLSNDVAKSNADIAHFLFESLSNTAVIRAFGAEKTESNKLKDKQSAVLTFLLKYQVLGAVSGSVSTAFGIVNSLIVFGYGGWQVLEGQLTVGSLVAFSVYQGRVFGPLQGLLDGVLSLQKSKVAIKRVRKILDIPPCFDDTGDTILTKAQMEQDICVNGVGFSYDKNTRILNNTSFTLPSGKTTALVGPSGVGKTTLCHLLLRLFNPDAGTITWAGQDFKTFDKNWFRKQVAMVSQETFLFHASILENIRFFKPEASQEEIEKAAEAAQIDDFIQSLPRGYDTLIGDRGTRLSGGQKQRLSIARAILLNPKVLIMDEATAFLDVKVENQIKQTLRQLMKDKTILLVSHRASSIENAHKIIVLDENGISYQGPAKELNHES
ncbi:ABC transporter ATP-binding protein [Desulfobacula toluolica]|uniref:ABC transporter ATP-binding protein n=1 Tax=Desulfobacula toluolica TaxID=28223 RepID=UPI00059E2F3B|nr:ABC transporter ATP-binding protein [Desulfobacula toluolica]